jgi:hypothetical protein
MTPTTPSPISDQAAGEREALKERLMEAIAEALGDALDCTRTWNAWSAGTMRDRDFVEVRGDADRLGEIADAALGVLSTAPTTGSAPETDDTFIEAYKVGARLCSTIHEANKAIVQGHGSSWYPLYRKNHPKPASPAASVLSEDAILAIAIDHGLGTAVVESIVKALLAASMGGDPQ